MKLIWTRNSSPLSQLIRWGLQEPVSHFAIVFDNKIVFHANLYGAHIEWYNTFRKNNEVVLEKDYPLSLEQEELVYQSIIDRLDGSRYDIRALIFFVTAIAANRYLGLAMPARNHFQSSDALLCTALVQSLPSWVVPNLKTLEGKDLEIISPYQIYQVANGSDYIPRL